MSRKQTRGIAAILIGLGIGLMSPDSTASYFSGVFIGGGVVATWC
jgi:hypothetical protein